MCVWGGGGGGTNQVRRRTLRLVNVCQVQLGWAEQVAAATHREEGSFKLHLECSCSVDSFFYCSSSQLFPSLLYSCQLFSLLFSLALPLGSPSSTLLLHCLHRHRIRRFPHYIVLLLEFAQKLEKRPWKFFCLGLHFPPLPSTPLHFPPLPSTFLHSSPPHSARSGEQRLAPNLVVAANSNVRPAQTLTLSLTRGF